MSSADLSRLGGAFVAWLLPMTLATGAILAGALLADRLLERRVSAAVRMLLYAAVLARLALPAGWESPLGLLGARSAGMVSALTVGPGMFTLAPLRVAPELSGAGWALIAHAAIALALLARWLHLRIAIERRLRGAPMVGLVDGIPVVRHPCLGPLVTGLWRPRIVVPAALADGAEGEALQWILRHERAHVRRHDLTVGTLIQIACMLAWPVLPVWIAARRLRALMEVACDEHALRGADGAARRRYGEVLLALADGPASGRSFSPVLSWRSPLERRLRALRARRRWPVALQAAVVGAAGALVFACAGEPPAKEGPGQSPQPPQLAPSAAGLGEATARGKLDPNLIVSTIRGHIKEVKACYEAGLRQKPDLAGRVSVQFTIATSGAVVNAALAESTLPDQEVTDCMVKVVRSWQFPRPDGGIVIVTFPFTFTPTSD